MKTLMEKYGFTQPEMNHLVKNKPTVVLFKEEEVLGRGILVVEKTLCGELNFELDTVKTLIVKYPFILQKTKEELHNFFAVMNSHHINNETAMDLLLTCPKLLAGDLGAQLKEIIFLFELYHKMSEQETIKIFRAFPFMAVTDLRKLTKFLGKFRMYQLTPR